MAQFSEELGEFIFNAGDASALRLVAAQPVVRRLDEAAGTGSGSGSTTSYSPLYRDSLLRILLKIEAVQTQVIEKILQMVPYVDDIPGANASNQQHALSAMRMSTTLLHHLRWMDFIVDSKALSDQLIEAISMLEDVRMKQELVMLYKSQGMPLGNLINQLLELATETELTISISDARKSPARRRGSRLLHRTRSERLTPLLLRTSPWWSGFSRMPRPRIKSRSSMAA